MLYSDELPEDLIYSQIPGCGCEGPCVDPRECACLVRSQGRNYSQAERLLLQLQSPQELLQRPVYECNSACSCRLDTCVNRLVQNHLEDTSALCVFDAGEKGRGIRASRNVSQGEFVCVYSGLYLGPGRARALSASQLATCGHVYVLVVREYAGVDSRLVFETTVDGACDLEDKQAPLPLACLINHSCDPNLTVIPVRVDSMLPYLAFFALRGIRADEELAYDYGEKSCEKGDPSAARQCLCGASNCRGFLPNPD
uniref:Histone-lysine N-methyltransferase SETMAR n=1 Tax=Mesocestoides corti TaxID=53468 RepID=A0A5K3F1U7_MESCO